MWRSYWKKEHWCVKCSGILSYRVVMYSNGTCPLCGNMNRSTMVEVNEIPYRIVQDAWWKFWTRRKEYKKKVEPPP